MQMLGISQRMLTVSPSLFFLLGVCCNLLTISILSCEMWLAVCSWMKVCSLFNVDHQLNSLLFVSLYKQYNPNSLTFAWCHFKLYTKIVAMLRQDLQNQFVMIAFSAVSDKVLMYCNVLKTRDCESFLYCFALCS